MGREDFKRVDLGYLILDIEILEERLNLECFRILEYYCILLYFLRFCCG